MQSLTIWGVLAALSCAAIFQVPLLFSTDGQFLDPGIFSSKNLGTSAYELAQHSLHWCLLTSIQNFVFKFKLKAKYYSVSYGANCAGHSWYALSSSISNRVPVKSIQSWSSLHPFLVYSSLLFILETSKLIDSLHSCFVLLRCIELDLLPCL